MRKMPTLGEQELELLKHVDDHGPVTVRDVAAHFEKHRHLARTTVLTMMERLRKKGFLSRSKVDGVFKYASKIESGDVIDGRISDFVEKTLGGSLSPLFAYFQSSKMTTEEIEELKRLAAKLESRKGE